MAGEYLQVFVSFPSRSDAEQLARLLVENRLAGCVQILGPMLSIYRWQGQVESAEEWLCLIKTTTSRYPALEEFVKNHHPYQVPEILAVPIEQGYPPYLQWLGECVSADDNPQPQ